MVTAVGMIIIASCLQVSCRIDELAARASALQALNDQVMLARNASGLAIWEVCGEDIDAHLTVRRLVRERSVFFPGSFDSDGAVRVVAALKVGELCNEADTGVAERLRRSFVGVRPRVFVAVGRVSSAAVVLSGLGEACPAGWENVSPGGRESAVLAARDGLILALMRRIGGDSSRESLAARRELAAKVAAMVEVGEAEFLPEQVCAVKGRVPIGCLLETDDRETSDQHTEAVGYGLPPRSDTLGASGRRVPVATNPEWVGSTCRVVGRGVVEQALASEEMRFEASRAARIDAMVELARRVDDLPLPIDGGWLASRVGELIAAHGEDADVWRFLLDSVKFGSEEVRGDVCQVSAELDLAPVWRLVASYEDHSGGSGVSAGGGEDSPTRAE